MNAERPGKPKLAHPVSPAFAKPPGKVGRLVSECRICRRSITLNVKEHALCPRCRYGASQFDELIDDATNLE